MNKKPLEDWQVELMPYFERAFILGFSICEVCGESVKFSSQYKQFTNDWWFDEAKAMKLANWVVPDTEHAYCADCAKNEGIVHNREAYTLSEL